MTAVRGMTPGRAGAAATAALAAALLLAGARPAGAFDCGDVRLRLDAARARMAEFDRRGMRDLERERKQVRQDLREELRTPDQLERRNEELARQVAGWRVESDALARREQEHAAAAASHAAAGDAKQASRERDRADEVRRDRARLATRVGEAEREIASNTAELGRIRSDARTAEALTRQRGEIDRALEAQRTERRGLAREVEFFEWVLEMCHERRGGASR